MEQHRSFQFVWPSPGIPYDQQVHGLLGGSSEVPSVSTGFEQSYRNPFTADMGNGFQPSNDVSMEDQQTGPPPIPSIPGAQTEARASRRARSEHLDWNAYKETIRELYIEQNNSLAETMEAMKEDYSFNASKKLYKTKFKEWNWQKNLSTDIALKLKETAERRKREEGKDTVFSFGGRVLDSGRLESTLGRTKKPKVTIDLTEVTTPEGVSYKTPKALVDSPARNIADHSVVEEIGNLQDASEDCSDDATDVGSLDGGRLVLRWRGHSRADLYEMWRMALKSRDTGKLDEAETMLSQASIGLANVIGKTNSDTVKVAYNLADLYATTGRMEEATALVEKVMQNHVKIYGCGDKRTQQNVLQAVELLNGWNREADALGLLSLSEELLNSSPSAHNTSKAGERISRKGKATKSSIRKSSQLDLSGVTQSVLQDLTSASIDHGLGVARTHVAVKNRATENLLLAIISQCGKSPALRVQLLKGLAELLGLYGKLGEATKHGAEFQGALGSLERAWEAYEWKEDSIESFDFMEAALQLVANALKYGYRIEASILFNMASEKGSEIFGYEDERSVWVNISIGIVYQTHMSWDDAEEWFQRAFSAALANKQWGPKDGIVRSLQNALEHRHFSYLSDEGRPFKTVFGVSGITVRPGRLHLE